MDTNQATRRATLAALGGGHRLAGGAERRRSSSSRRWTASRAWWSASRPAAPPTRCPRLYAERLRGLYAPQIVVENRAGAGGRSPWRR
jgi:hypothetical protein